jgi:exonuclease I
VEYIFYNAVSSESGNRFLDSSQLLRFSAIITDESLNIIDTHDLTCRYRKDIVPDPIHVFKNEATPLECDNGLTEFEFAKSVNAIMTRNNSEKIGFQSNPYEDEYIRRLFYRNLFDPYAHEWKNNSSRFDIERTLGFIHSVKPDLLEWPESTSVSQSLYPKTYFKDFDLETFARLNPVKRNDQSLFDGSSFSMRQAASLLHIFTLLKEDKSLKGIHHYMMELRTKNQIRDTFLKPKQPLLVAGLPVPGVKEVSNRASVMLPVAPSKFPNGYFMVNMNYPNLEASIKELMSMEYGELKQRFNASNCHRITDTPVVHIKSGHGVSAIPALKLQSQTLTDLHLPELSVIQTLTNTIAPMMLDLGRRLSELEFKEFKNDPKIPVDMNLYGTPFISFGERDIVNRIVNSSWDQWLPSIDAQIKDSTSHSTLTQLANASIMRNYGEEVKKNDPSTYRNWVQRCLTVFSDRKLIRHPDQFLSLMDKLRKEDGLLKKDSNRDKIQSIEDFFNKYPSPVFKHIQTQREKEEKVAFDRGDELVFGKEPAPF